MARLFCRTGLLAPFRSSLAVELLSLCFSVFALCACVSVRLFFFFVVIVVVVDIFFSSSFSSVLQLSYGAR